MAVRDRRRRGARIVASVLNEVSHHGTQVCALRDLIAGRAERSARGRRLAIQNGGAPIPVTSARSADA